MTPEQKVLRKVLSESPFSIRDLAKDLSVSHVALTRMRDGDFQPSPKVLRELAGVLKKKGTKCQKLAKELDTVIGRRHG